MNSIANDITKMTSAIVETGWSMFNGLKKNDIILLEEAVEQLAGIDINANKIDNKIISRMPLFCQNENNSRETISYFRIIDECVQTAHLLRYFCKHVTTYINEYPSASAKEYIRQIFQYSMDAFEMSAKLIEKRVYVEDIFRQIKTKHMAGRDLCAKLEKNIEFDLRYAFVHTRILNAAEKLDEIFKKAVMIARIILLMQDNGKLRIC
ncbi:MAG: hypothetical protein LBF71_03625 [Campylobacteraceae bacterium]|jgi:hypothetical protein|nr:hypothetical protein [Campylobacteraceae bacterium]